MGKFYREVGDELTLVVRSIAWLNAVPESPAGLPDKRTRRERIDDDGGEIDLPVCSAPFLLGVLLEIGPALSTGMGLVSIGWRDVQAWQECTGVRLPPWQSQMLVRLSREYVSFHYAAEKRDCRAPWLGESEEDRRARVDRQLQSVFGSLMNKKGR